MATGKAETRPLVEVSFVFIDSLGHAIEGLNVKIESESINFIGTTDDQGHAMTSEEAKRGQQISISVKKRNGAFDLKGKVIPRKDINTYTIRSPELHFEATTKLTPKEELEEELNVPVIKDQEVMTISRLFGDLAPFIGSVEKITEIGKVTKDFPTKKAIKTEESTPSAKPKFEIEHHYKVVKTEKPHTIALSMLGARLNYPASTEISDATFKSMAEQFDCEIAAIKAVTFTESAGSGFLENGLPDILFERHHFYALTDPNVKRIKKKGSKPLPHPYAKFSDICSPKGGGYGSAGIHQYERLVKAGRLNLEAAIMSCSWGAFQVLGEYWDKFGYSSAEELANDCIKSIDGQVKIFCGFLNMPEKKSAIKALKSKDWTKFTAAYNGGKWETTNPKYPTNMADFYEKLKVK
jgi:hypothetical protein